MIAALAAAGCASTPRETGPAGASNNAYECGGASYYSDSLAGNSTASGEPYNPTRLTAAHKSLPFGTHLRVTRVDDGASVDVIVNDRGPFVSGRIIDLSRSAAQRIDLIREGVAEVCISLL